MLACGLYRQAEHEGRVLRFCYTNPHKVSGAAAASCGQAGACSRAPGGCRPDGVASAA
jgi:hypothetical protein